MTPKPLPLSEDEKPVGLSWQWYVCALVVIACAAGGYHLLSLEGDAFIYYFEAWAGLFLAMILAPLLSIALFVFAAKVKLNVFELVASVILILLGCSSWILALIAFVSQ